MSSNASSPNSKCLCSPTSHPGSFRCALHRNFNKKPSTRSRTRVVHESPKYLANAKPAKMLLFQIMKPSSHCIKRRRNFQPKPSRFCLLNGNSIRVGLVGL
ncbi:hypothetical protein F3Y22_tig00116976pilonHSYRG00090 [Hibiscus syriacus]|uniref:Serine-rich protein-related n=1 Tax=Hibiscus syriacus TaxID=106335 RepID=A0A6A2XHJ1_HIBSY|nr:hypothetical protein F3Y22_tig00116976pilonHSYRG00090 [Hibiscus syriacus]